MFGSHLSIAGGMHLALLAAERLGMGTVQVFTKNQQQWRAPPLVDVAVAAWKAEVDRLRYGLTVSHDSYLINLASPDPASRRRSVAASIVEHLRCAALGIPLLVMHPGAHLGDGEARGIARVARSLDAVHKATPAGVITCLEVTAGQGTCLGHRLEHLAEIISKLRRPERAGVCLDTAHLFAAGYDLRGPRRYAALMRDVDRTVGLDRVRVWHLNDSLKPLGSRVDRHAHIGRGEIGLDGFRPIVRDRRWRKVPKILETAKGPSPDGRDWDAVNLETLRGLARS
jgi:deoxyribonuclease-4